MEIQKVQNIVLVGSTGSGKSSTGNMLIEDIPNSPFIVGNDEISCTYFIDEHVNLYKQIRVLDTPGFGDNRFHEKEIDKIIKDLTIRLTNPAIESTGVIDAFLLPVKMNPKPQTLKSDLEHLMDLFGSVALKTLIIMPIYMDGNKRTEEDVLKTFSKMDELMRILKEGKKEEPNLNWFCLWDNLNPILDQEINLFRKILTLESYTHEKFLEAAEEIKKRLDEQVKQEVERQVSIAKSEFAHDKEKLEKKIKEIEKNAKREIEELLAAVDRAQNETKKFADALERMDAAKREEMAKMYEKFARERDEAQREAQRLMAEMNENNQRQLQRILDSNAQQMSSLQGQLAAISGNSRRSRGCSIF